MPRSTTPEQRQRPPTKTLFRCGQFEQRVTKIRRRRVKLSISCGRFDLRCTKSREARIHLLGPPFREEAFKTKQKTVHTPNSIASSCGQNDVKMDSEGFIDDAQDLRLWPSRIELAFTQMMVEEVKQDSSLTRKNSFTIRHWSRIDDELYNQFKVRSTINRLKQKYHCIRQAYKTFVKLKNHTGFGWDDQRKTVMAPDDVWDQHVKTHPKAKVFRKKGLDHIDLLDVLFANSQATGALARASTQGPLTFAEERDIQSAFFGVGINSNTDSFLLVTKLREMMTRR